MPLGAATTDEDLDEMLGVLTLDEKDDDPTSPFDNITLKDIPKVYLFRRWSRRSSWQN